MRAPLGVALVAGLAVAFSLPPWGWWPLSIVGCALYVAAQDGHQRFRRGFVFGAAWTYVGMAWMWQLTIPGYLFAGVFFGVFHGAAAHMAPTGRWRFAGLPLAHTLVEAIRFSFPFGGIPLASLGIAQVAGPLAPVARVGGVIALTWLTLQLGSLLAAAVTVARAGGRRDVTRVTTAVAAGVCVLLVVAGYVGPRGSDMGERLDVAAVQGGGEQGTRAADTSSALVTQAHVDTTKTIAPDESLDLVLWPENVIDTEDFAASWQLTDVAAQAQRLSVPFAVGVTEDVAGQPGRITNAQVVVSPEGDVTSRYDKVRRVPFGEYVPLRGLLESLGAPVDQVASDAIAGTTPAVVDLADDHRAAVVISWEVFFAGRAREGVKEGGELILNPTNGSSYTGTIVQTQQVASSRLRAIETGRWVVQAAPTGFTAVIDADGDVLMRSSVSERTVLRAEIELRDGRTWYVRLGERPWIALVALCLVALHVVAHRRPQVNEPSTTS